LISWTIPFRNCAWTLAIFKPLSTWDTVNPGSDEIYFAARLYVQRKMNYRTYMKQITSHGLYAGRYFNYHRLHPAWTIEADANGTPEANLDLKSALLDFASLLACLFMIHDRWAIDLALAGPSLSRHRHASRPSFFEK